MSGSTDMDAVWDGATRLLACVHQTLALTPEGAPARHCVVPGSEVAWDECDCGGQLTVHILRTYPSDSFPIIKQTGPFGRCEAVMTVAEYVVTILRCTPTLSDMGDAPPCADLSAAALIDQRDRWAVRRGVACCWDDLDPLVQPQRLIQEQLAVGALGACAGSELHVFVGYPNCLPCDAQPPPPPVDITGIDGGDTAPPPADLIDAGAVGPPPADIFDGGSS